MATPAAQADDPVAILPAGPTAAAGAPQADPVADLARALAGLSAADRLRLVALLAGGPGEGNGR